MSLCRTVRWVRRVWARTDPEGLYAELGVRQYDGRGSAVPAARSPALHACERDFCVNDHRATWHNARYRAVNDRWSARLHSQRRDDAMLTCAGSMADIAIAR